MLHFITWIEALSEKKKQAIIGFACAIAGTALLFSYFQSGPDALKYASAEEAFDRWEKNPTDSSLYKKMRTSLNGAPGLLEKYQAKVAQKLIDSHQIGEALLFAPESIARLKQEAPYHGLFAENTLLIEKGDFQRALEEAVALKEKMEGNFSQGGALLYGFNLLRIASLQKELENNPGEKAALEEAELFFEKNPSLLESMNKTFVQSNLNLQQYITKRKQDI